MFYLRSFLLIQALFTIFIAGGLFFRGSGLKNRTLAFFTCLFGLDILIFLFGTSAITAQYPEFYTRGYFSIGFLYGPLLYLHFKAIIGAKLNLTYRDLWHLIPLLIVNVYVFDIITMSGIDRIIAIETNFNGRIMNLNYGRALHQLMYGLWAFVLFYKHRKHLSTNSVFYLSSISILYVITTLVISFYTLFANSWRDFSYYYLVSTSIVLIIAYVLYTDPKFFQNIKKKYKNSALDDTAMQSIKTKIDVLLKEEQVYLKNNLNIDFLAQELEVRSHHISQTFTNFIKQNFNDYINAYRIEHAKRLLHNPLHNRYKIEAIAKESGFNNKVTFYSAFSKFEGTTPAKFRKKATSFN